MDIVSTLNNELLKQPFQDGQNESVLLAEGQRMAFRYAGVENAIAVLSDLRSNRSYIYNGGLAEGLNIAARGSTKEIHSIWEEDIFDRIQPDDLLNKHLLELHFFHFLKSLPVGERSDYHIASRMRMADKSGVYIPVYHRMFYICSCSSGNLWLALCLYNHSFEGFDPEVSNGIIVNSATGAVIKPDNERCADILSSREKEILRLIERGKMSKEIADILSISKNTVDRHRQNILEKLRVKNSLEACRMAKLMDLL